MSTESPASGRPTVCLLSPLGEGGLAVVRLFGPGSVAIARRLFHPMRAWPGAPAQLALGRVVDPQSNEMIDEGILRELPAGCGVELTLHGGVRIVQRVVAACESAGSARLDWHHPDDREALWQQAYVLHRVAGTPKPALAADIEMTLPQARTRATADWLVAQGGPAGLAGFLARLIERAGQQGADIRADLDALLAEAPAWRRAIDGVRVAIVGPTNAGKSTLLNALAGAEAAIVSDAPGTTRDYVSQWASVEGVPVELIDTAGLRDRAEELERMAGALADPVVRSAPLRLILLDASTQPASEDLNRLASLAQAGPALVAINKTDLPATWDAATGARRLVGCDQPVSISARTGEGLAELRSAIRRALGIGELSPARAGLFRDRQSALVRGALERPFKSARSSLLGCILG